MRKIKRIWICPFILMGMLIMLSNSCKKDNNKFQTPVLITTVVSNIIQTSATCGGTIISDGGAKITSRGVCWSTSQNPTITDNKTTDGSGIGDFTSNIFELIANTTYYVCAYATNSVGTSYGSIISFKTLHITITDIDGNVYNTVVIGTQTWMVENLKVTKYRNGNLINTTDPVDRSIQGESQPRYQWPAGGNEMFVSTYGRLYTLYTVTDPRGLCPSGWHAPTDEEWTTLEIYLQNNGYNYNGYSDKDSDRTTNNKTAKSLADTTYWAYSSSTGAIGNNDYPAYRNKSGFTALPGGLRRYNGNFDAQDFYGQWWSTTRDYNDYSTSYWTRYLFHSDDFVTRYNEADNYGLSVRCLKD